MQVLPSRQGKHVWRGSFSSRSGLVGEIAANGVPTVCTVTPVHLGLSAGNSPSIQLIHQQEAACSYKLEG